MAWFCLCFTGGVGLMGYSWSGGLRQTATAELSRHWCYTYVFLSGFTRFTRKYSRKVDARGKQTLLNIISNWIWLKRHLIYFPTTGQTLLSQCSNHFGRQ